MKAHSIPGRSISEAAKIIHEDMDNFGRIVRSIAITGTGLVLTDSSSDYGFCEIDRTADGEEIQVLWVVVRRGDSCAELFGTKDFDGVSVDAVMDCVTDWARDVRVVAV